MTRDIFEAVPIWVVFLASCTLIALAWEAGHRFALWRADKEETQDDSSTSVIVGGILGLVSFVLAFSFSMAAQHHETRKAIVLEEANVIGTAYLRTDLLQEPKRSQAADLIYTYTKLRLEAASENYSQLQFEIVRSRSEEIQSDLWKIVSDYALANPSPNTPLVISALNELIDIHTVRVTKGVGGRMSTSTWITLFLLVGLSMVSAGYNMSRNSLKRPPLSPVLVIAFASILTLIADLDNPRYGFIHADNRPMESTLKSMVPPL